MEDGDDSESGSGESEGEDQEDNDEGNSIMVQDDTLDDFEYEDECVDDLHDHEDTPEKIADAEMMDAFSPETPVINNTLQALPSSLTPTLTSGTGQESNTHGSIVEDTRRSLAIDINESGYQLAMTSESSTPLTKRPSKKRRRTLGLGLAKCL